MIAFMQLSLQQSGLIGGCWNVSYILSYCLRLARGNTCFCLTWSP